MKRKLSDLAMDTPTDVEGNAERAESLSRRKAEKMKRLALENMGSTNLRDEDDDE